MTTVIYYGIPILSCICYFILNEIMPEKQINKYVTISYTGFVNALITGISSWYIVSNKNMIEYLSSSDPENIPFSYSIGPLILYGFGLFDIYMSINSKQLDFLLHGLMVVIFLSIGFYYNSLHVSLLCSFQEMSSIFLNIRYNDSISLLFFIFYTYFRIIKFPIICVKYIYIEPFNKTLYYFTIVGMICSNSLNFYWYGKMIKLLFKKLRKIN